MIIIGKKWDKDAVYIGQGSPLGNRFAKADMTPEERDYACDQFYIEFWNKVKANDLVIMTELKRLLSIAMNGDLILGCYCHPKRCHGLTIKQWLETELLFVR